jgi:hypothetical protein
MFFSQYFSFPLSVSFHHCYYQRASQPSLGSWQQRYSLAHLEVSDRNVDPHIVSRDYRTPAFHCFTLSIPSRGYRGLCHQRLGAVSKPVQHWRGPRGVVYLPTPTPPPLPIKTHICQPRPRFGLAPRARQAFVCSECQMLWLGCSVSGRLFGHIVVGPDEITHVNGFILHVC